MRKRGAVLAEWFRYLRHELVVNGLVAAPILPIHHRWRVYRRLGFEFEPGGIHPRVHISHARSVGGRVTLGRNGYVNEDCRFFNATDILIGAEVGIGPEVMFLTTTHELGGPDRRGLDLSPAPIVVEDGCWIGARATIMPGVTVGHGCVVAVGAVVTKDCEPDGLYAGVPARRVRDLPT